MNANATLNFQPHQHYDAETFSTFKSQLFINGEFVDGSAGNTVTRRSPAFEHIAGEYAEATERDALNAIEAARHAFDSGDWVSMNSGDRSNLLLQIARKIEDDKEAFALLESMETGKPIAQARGEIEGSIDIWRYAASLARNLHGDSYNNLGDDMLGLTIREPVGVVSVITPWNFPFLILAQKLPFALAAGCTAVIKPSEITSGTTIKLAKILQDIGLPKGVVNILVGSGKTLGNALVNDERVDMVTFTGSTGVGQHVAAQATKAMKKISMELGGKNPQIVLPDCDFDAAVDAVVFGVFFNAGECCNSGSRLLVHEDIAEKFIAAVIEKSKQVKVGDPLDETVLVGAMIHQGHVDDVMTYIETAKKQGAKVPLGGGLIEHDKGLYIEPTIVVSDDPSQTICQEEVFGPVLTVLTFKELDEAIDIANGTEFGLSASVWSKDIDTCLTAARKFEAGTVWVNTFMDGFPELPFGGYKQSGLGRELGRLSAEEYTELKTIQLHMGERRNWWVK